MKNDLWDLDVFSSDVTVLHAHESFLLIELQWFPAPLLGLTLFSSLSASAQWERSRSEPAPAPQSIRTYTLHWDQRARTTHTHQPPTCHYSSSTWTRQLSVQVRIEVLMWNKRVSHGNIESCRRSMWKALDKNPPWHLVFCTDYQLKWECHTLCLRFVTCNIKLMVQAVDVAKRLWISLSQVLAVWILNTSSFGLHGIQFICQLPKENCVVKFSKVVLWDLSSPQS